MINLFIDTNVLLSFFHYTSDDLEELLKLDALVGADEITLWVPGQLEQEFGRNRDAKIADALKTLNSQSLRLKFPQISQQYPEFETLRSHQKEYERLHAELMAKVKNDAMNETLQADQVVSRSPRSHVIELARGECPCFRPPRHVRACKTRRALHRKGGRTLFQKPSRPGCRHAGRTGLCRDACAIGEQIAPAVG